jgi:hypothetical protein
MRSSVKRLNAGGLALAAILALASSAWAQPVVPNQMNSPLFQVNPYLAAYKQNLAAGRAAALAVPPAAMGGNPYMAAYNPYLGGGNLLNNPYGGASMSSYGGSGGYGGYPYNPYMSYYDPFGGYFRGLSSLVSSYGQYYKDINQARLINQQVYQSKLDTRRRIIDEWRYEQSLIPTSEEMRRKNRERDLAYARQNPPLTAVLDGTSLNTLLDNLKLNHAKDQRGPRIPLDEEALRKINVTTTFGGNIGLLKNGGKLTWPDSLQGAAFAQLRRQFDQNIIEAVNGAKANGHVDAALFRDLDADLRSMNDALRKSVDTLSPSQYIEARRYLSLLADALKALHDQNVQNYFNRKYEARGKTVGDLVDYMAKEGLRFAPAVPGDGAAYQALQNYMGAYDDAISRLVSNK